MKRLLIVGILLVCFASLTFAGEWILDSKNNKLSADLEVLVAGAGGTLVNTIDEVGIAVAEFSTREEAEAMEAYGFTVMPDISLNWLPGNQGDLSVVEHIGSDESYYGYQWHLPLMGADAAWETGQTGRGARVAVVDTGVDYTHPDLAANVDMAAGASFVPGVTDFYDDRGHGTHVAGIIAAADNGMGTIGVAPEATIIGVKVLNDDGFGETSWVVAGIIHAANQNVDIINLSLGGTLYKNGGEGYTAADAAKEINLFRKALRYANSKGAVVVHSAGNSSMDMDHNGNLIVLPAEAFGGNDLVVSATGPTDALASYSNFGRSAISVAAPGGDFTNYPNPGWHLDMILSCYPGGWSFMAGTSMAAPCVSGVAALIIAQDETLTPAQLRAALIKSADDLGQPGTDPAYGKGRVNAFEAIQ